MNHVYVRDRAHRRIGEIDDYTMLTFTGRHSGVGVWQLSMAATTPQSLLLLEGEGIIIERDNEVLASGPIASRRREKNPDSDRWTVSGFEDSVWLARRLARPTYDSLGVPVTTFDSAEDTIKALVNDAVMSFDSERRVPYFNLAPTFHRGRPVATQADFQRLDELVTSVALAGDDMGWRAVQDGRDGFSDREVIFDVYEPLFKPDARFSTSFGNLEAFDYEESAPTLNHVIRTSDGASTEVVNQTSIDRWGRIEGPAQQGSADDDPMASAQEMYEALATGSSSLAISLTPRDTARLRYGSAWQLGDGVTVEIDGVVFSDLVREVTFTWTAEQGEEIAAVIGSAEAVAPTVPRLFAAQRKLSQRLYRLQRRI